MLFLYICYCRRSIGIGTRCALRDYYYSQYSEWRLNVVLEAHIVLNPVVDIFQKVVFQLRISFSKHVCYFTIVNS